MITIEQRFIGGSSFQSLCDRLAPGSQLTIISEMTGFLARFGVIHALKIRHIRPDGSIRHVVEILETRTPRQDWYVILTLDRDFTGTEALEAYQQYRAIASRTGST